MRQTAQAADPHASARIAEYAKRLVQHFQPRIVGGYWAIKTELDVIPAAALCEVSDISLCLPVTGRLKHRLSFITGIRDSRWILGLIAQPFICGGNT